MTVSEAPKSRFVIIASMATSFMDRRRGLDSASDSDTQPSTECVTPSDSKRSSVQPPSNKFSRFIESLEKTSKPVSWGKPKKAIRPRPLRRDLNPFAEDFLPIHEYNPDAIEFVAST